MTASRGFHADARRNRLARRLRLVAAWLVLARALAAAAAVAAVFSVAASCAQRPPSFPFQPSSASTRQSADDVDRRYVTAVQPLLKTYCYSCHGGSSPAAKVDLTPFDTAAEVTAAYDLWQRLHGRLDRREMPPRG